MSRSTEASRVVAAGPQGPATICPDCGASDNRRSFRSSEALDTYAILRPSSSAGRGPGGEAAGLVRKIEGLVEELGRERTVVLSETWHVALPEAWRELDGLRSRRGAPAVASTAIGQPPSCAACRTVVRVHLRTFTGAGPLPRISPLGGSLSGDGPNPSSGHVLERACGTREIRLARVEPDRPGSRFEEQCARVFELAASLLESRGATFRHVVRTWIYLRHMQRDYDTLNRVRRGFFRKAGVNLHPASTGIEGAPLDPRADVSLGLEAIVPGSRPLEIVAMRSDTFNDAAEYGAFFSRGLRVHDHDVTLYLSGTAAVDREGRSVGEGDLERQVERMLENVRGLLDGGGAGLGDVVQATTYLKRSGDRRRYRELVRPTGLLDLPHAVVEAEVCRPELLCEIELVARRASRTS